MPTYMRKDVHGYRFLRPVPKDLCASLGKANVVKRLGKDFKKAKVLCAELTVQTDRQFHAARASYTEAQSLDAYLKLPANRRLKKLNYTPQLAEQLASLWMHSLDIDLVSRRVGLDDEELNALDDNIRDMLPGIKRALSSGRVSAFHESINQLIVGRGHQLVASDGEWQALTYDVLKHVLLAYKILAARQSGEQLETPDLSALPPPLPAAWEIRKPEPKPAKRLSDVTPEYQAHLSSSDPKSQSTYLSIWQRFVDFAEDRKLASVTSADVFNFLKSRLNDPVKPWSYGYTSGRAKRVLQEAFGLAKTLKLIDGNPAAELEVLPKISAKEEASRQKPRFPYKPEHLNTLFSSEWYKPESSNWRGKMREDLGARYWIPLICMWHGLRVTEVAQLQTQDVDLKENSLCIQDADVEIGPARSIKNSSTRRVVPIHPTLIALGFREFVSTLRQHYERGPLFPSALPEVGGKSPKWGRAYEQPFLRFMRDDLGLGSGYGNHSFRHALEDRIRAANVDAPWPEGLARAYTGRSSTRSQDKDVMRAEGSEKLYGQGYELEAVRKYISQIRYPGVHIPPAFSDWLRTNQMLSERAIESVRKWARFAAD